MLAFVQWVMRLIDQTDRQTITQVWADLMPPEVFEAVRSMVRESLVADDWSDLTKRVPAFG